MLWLILATDPRTWHVVIKVVLEMNSREILKFITIFLSISFLIIILKSHFNIQKYDSDKLDVYSNAKLDNENLTKLFSRNFTRNECKELLKEWEPRIDNLKFEKDEISESSELMIKGGDRLITFVYYNNDSEFEGCNIFDIINEGMDEKEKEFEERFDCKEEECHDLIFKNGRFLYVHEIFDGYAKLKYLLKVNIKGISGEPTLYFQILYFQKDLSKFIKNREVFAETGNPCDN